MTLEKIIQTVWKESSYAGKQCKRCQASFDITDKDLEFYDKISPIFAGKKYSIPTPTLCPDCRQQRRLTRRNERKIYHRKSDASQKPIISIYSPDKPYKVYKFEERRSDARDPLDYGRDYDPNKSFFKQFDELLKAVPHIALRFTNSENSEYTNMSGYNKNCYLLFASEYNEDCGYGTQLIKSKNSYDTLNCSDLDHCYETTNCDKCYNISFARNSKDCSNCMYIEDCIWCSNCLFCTHLVNAQYCIFNKQYSKDEYMAKKKALLSNIHDQIQKFEDMCKTWIKKNLSNINVENSTGNYLFQSKNLRNCFDLSYAEDCAYTCTWFEIKDLMDVCHTTRWTLGYECTSLGYDSYNAIWICGMRTSNSCMYVFDLHTSSNMFGCANMRDKQYCILNKQYTHEEYEKLVPQIIEKMQADGERWEFFPVAMSSFGYNETVAMEYFPLTKEEAIKKGFKRCDYEIPLPQVEKTLKADEIPDIKNVTDDILNQAIICEVTWKPFRIILQELDFYRKHDLPLPRRHPDQRHTDRMAMRNPRKLFDKKCAKCGVDIQTTYAPDRPENVYCESCYNKEVYG